MEEKQLSVESVGIRETQEMLSGSDRDGEAEHAFLHFISGMRTSGDSSSASSGNFRILRLFLLEGCR